MEYLDNIIELILIFTAGLVSPGPDFAIITKLAINNSRKTALIASLGLATGVLIHSSYLLFGIGTILLNSAIGMILLSIIGGTYLSYLGWLGVTIKKRQISEYTIPETKDMNPYKAFLTGLLTNLLNPKVVLFLSALLISVIDIEDKSSPFILYQSIMFLGTLIWFSIVSWFLSSPIIQKKLRSAEIWISRVTGSILLIFGLKLILEVIF